MLNILTGFFSGIISGMGIGGGAVLIPALVFVSGTAQQTAQGINLTYFIPTAVAALFVHIRNRNVELKSAAIIGGFGIIGAAVGSMLAAAVGAELLRRMFGIFLLLIGVYEIRTAMKN